MDRVVICMKWGSVFAPDYVNVLHRASRRHLSGPFRFVCLTDDGDGLEKGVEVFPIPDLGLSEAMWRHGAWPKLGVFLPDLYGLQGRALFIDLDMMICGDLDEMFDHPGDFIGIDTSENWRPGGGTSHTPLLGTGIFAYDLGGQSQILDRFLTDREGIFAEDDIEQVWVQKAATEVTYWPGDWVISFKRHLRRLPGVDVMLPPKAPPPGAKVLAFHGDPRPAALLSKDAGRWERLPHMGRGQVKWLAQYWVKNGGRLPDADGNFGSTA